jgi:hypothetical protein
MLSLRFLLLLALSGPASAAPYFVQCYDFGCKTTQELHYSAANWDEIKALFTPASIDGAAEKQAIRRAVAAMERISGELSGTFRDKGGNYPGSDIIRQMDCIDESTNTFQYLAALDELNLLKWHRVDNKQRRIVWFVAVHWTATITELDSGERFVVDSWYRDNGELPYIQRLADWERRSDFPVAYNPELAAN